MWVVNVQKTIYSHLKLLVMKKIILSMVAILSTVMASAQISYNIKGGLGAGTFYGLNDDYTSDARFTWRVGVGMEYAFNSAWAITPSLMFVHSGAISEASRGWFNNDLQLEKTETDKYVTNLNYLQLPINVQWKTPISNNSNIALFLGPYVAVGVGGKTKREYILNNITEGVVENSFYGKVSSFKGIEDGGAGFKRWDFGLNYGANFEINKFTVGFVVDLGLIRNQSTLKSKTLNVNAMVGYRF